MNMDHLRKNDVWNVPWLPVWRPEDGPHPRKRPRSLCPDALLALMLLLMLACAAVNDPSQRWKTSGTDPALEGTWAEMKGDSATGVKLRFVKREGDQYALMNDEHADNKPLAVRTFTRGGRQFMLALHPENEAKEEPKGVMMFYEVKDGILRLSYLDPKVMGQAIKDGRLKGSVPAKEGALVEREPILDTLDDATCDALVALASGKDAVQTLAEYKHQAGR